MDASIVKKPKVNNGWTDEQETLMSEWADTASCYRWLHDKAEKYYTEKNLGITIPVIILSTLTGSANFALNSVLGGQPSAEKYAQLAIGGISILVGILSTLGNFLRYAQNSEAHRVATISWGKFHRLIRVELNLKSDDREDCQDFLKMCRNEQDRLIELSPQVTDNIKNEFKKKFGNIPNLKRPDICDELEHTTPFNDKEARMRIAASEAALTLMHRKRILKELVISDLEEKIRKGIEEQMSEQADKFRVVIQAECGVKAESAFKTEHSGAKLSSESELRVQDEIEEDKKKKYNVSPRHINTVVSTLPDTSIPVLSTVPVATAAALPAIVPLAQINRLNI